MAEISRFYGIVAALFFREHGVAHVHFYYGGDVASIRIRDGALLEGYLPPPVLRLVREFVKLRKKDLVRSWNAARLGKLKKVRPLR